MAEQTSAAPEKSAADVTKSHARENAEKSGGANVRSQSQTRANFGTDGDNDSLVGKSLEYNSGPGREAYPADSGGYATDAVNDLPHLAVHFDR